MMWGYGDNNSGWMWVFGLLAIVSIALLVLLAVRMFSTGAGRGGEPGGGQAPGGGASGRSRARQILDERFAQGELTAEQYREQVQLLGEDRQAER
jgi:putative membrane protein